jgi:hypothetical protein
MTSGMVAYLGRLAARRVDMTSSQDFAIGDISPL